MTDTANTGAALTTQYLATSESGVSFFFDAARDASVTDIVRAMVAAEPSCEDSPRDASHAMEADENGNYEEAAQASGWEMLGSDGVRTIWV